MKFDGNKLANQRTEELKQKIGGRKFKLVSIFDPNNMGAAKYTDIKAKKAAELGIEFVKLPVAGLQLTVSEEIEKLNKDETYEAVAEGGITRTLNIYYCQDAGRIGPVRSARTYFLDMVSEYGPFPLYAHVGGANCDESTGSGCQNGAKADALGQIEKYKWYGKNDLSGGFSIGTPQFKRLDIGGENIATEHTMYSNTNLLWDFAKKNRKITNVDENGKAWDTGFTYYPFEKDAPSGDRPTSQIVSFDYWSSMSGYDVQWTYNPADNLYYRKNGGAVHNDRNTGKQLTAKNVVLLFMKESHAHDGYENDQHLLYGDIGTGNATVFMNGKQIKATWKKANRTAHLQLLDTSGKEISLTAGKLWFHILPLDTDVTVK
jgi:uncharacterized protein YneR